MKRLLFVFVCMAVLSTAVFGQGGGQRSFNPEDMAKRTVEQLTTELKLTADQAKKVEPIVLKYAKESQKMRESAGGDREKMREESQKIATKQTAELEKVLTKDQVAAYKKYLSERQNRMGGGQGGQGGGQRPQRNN